MPFQNSEPIFVEAGQNLPLKVKMEFADHLDNIAAKLFFESVGGSFHHNNGIDDGDVAGASVPALGKGLHGFKALREAMVRIGLKELQASDPDDEVVFVEQGSL